VTNPDRAVELLGPGGAHRIEERSPVRSIRAALERAGRGRLLSVLDVAAVLVVAATFAQLGPPELLFHVVFVILTAEAFAFGRRICLQRVAALSIALVIYASLPTLGVAAAPLELTEWPLMFTIAVLVAWMADREQSVARRYAGLYRATRERLVRAQEEERGRLARDLHDGIGQTLTALRLTLDDAAATSGPEREADIERARDLARDAIEDTGRVADGIRPPRLEQRGLASALRALGSGPSGHVVVSIAPGADVRLTTVEAELEMFRIAQEAVRNAIRHAQASHIGVSLQTTRDGLRLEVTDDGIGCAGPLADPRRLGIVGMQERAVSIGGQFGLSSVAGQGTTVAVSLPTQRPDAVEG
jgi:signal transduction histidine kinase